MAGVLPLLVYVGTAYTAACVVSFSHKVQVERRVGQRGAAKDGETLGINRPLDKNDKARATKSDIIKRK